MIKSEKVEGAFWRLVRAGLWMDSMFLDGFEPLDEKEWRVVINMAQRSGSLGVLIDAIELLPEICLPPLPLIQKLVKQKVKLVKQHEQHNLTIRRLMQLFDNLGVKSVLLKGQSLAQNFENPESRVVGDIDVYVGAEAIDALVEKLKFLGHTCEEDLSDNDKHIVFRFEDIPIELHRDSIYLFTPKTDRLYQTWWKESISTKIINAFIDKKGHWHLMGENDVSTQNKDYQKVVLPDHTINVFYTFCHLFYHYMGFQFQFKQFLDFARFLKVGKENFDLELLHSKLIELKMLEPWQVVGCYLNKNLGLKKEDIPFYNESKEHKSEKFGKYIHERIFDSTKDLEANRPEGRLASKLFSYRLSLVVGIRTFNLFPYLTIAHFYSHTIRGLRLLSNPRNNRK